MKRGIPHGPLPMLGGLLCLLFGSALHAEHPLDKKLPSLEGLHGYGCSLRGPINLHRLGDPRPVVVGVWRVLLWADHKASAEAKPERDWKLIYAYREKRFAGLKDCDRFLKRVAKALETFRAKEGKEVASNRKTSPPED